MHVLDLTLPLDEKNPVFQEPGGYRDPAFSSEPWATLDQQGYSVHRLEMGSHSGTHLDAPAHFHRGGRTVDQVPPEALVGEAVVIDLRRRPRVRGNMLAKWADAVSGGGLPLFLAPPVGILLSRDAVAAVADWRPRLLLYAGRFLDEAGSHHHNRVWLGADIPLVTDLDAEAAAQVRDGDLLLVAPLPLTGMDGAPCRVLALQSGDR